MKKLGKLVLWVSISGALLISAIIVLANVWVVTSTTEHVFDQLKDLPDTRVALVLGTSEKLVSGQPNPFFENRMAAAALLFREGKVTHFILSGDNRTRYYNEPASMKRALMKLGVPASAITLDYAGLRTLDSVVRSKKIFGQNKLIIITQSFHSYRAVFISRYYDIDAVALVAREPDNPDGAKVYWREYLARTIAVFDLYVFKTKPRHLGEKEPLAI